LSSWFRLVVAFHLVVAIVLSPLRAAAAIPMLIAYDVPVPRTAIVRVEAGRSLRPELGRVPEYVYDDRSEWARCGTKPPAANGNGAVHAYDDTLDAPSAVRGPRGSSTTLSPAVPAAEGLPAAANAGKTALGHFPAYLQLAEREGAAAFNIPTEAWNALSEGERWATNQAFLDQAIARGDRFILATQPSLARAGSYFARELEYLAGKGYVPNAEGTALVPGGQ
jgi:hypothetical protein